MIIQTARLRGFSWHWLFLFWFSYDINTVNYYWFIFNKSNYCFFSFINTVNYYWFIRLVHL